MILSHVLTYYPHNVISGVHTSPTAFRYDLKPLGRASQIKRYKLTLLNICEQRENRVFNLRTSIVRHFKVLELDNMLFT